ncbi:DUF7144 family membrane protein [Amycolatopsis taiwanensis]|uniref:Membrane protein n=1 Tax=Amycolatopsis taiwanensis TaxID=342230 RepID=A0A9W6VF88_9PSEU|nr:hypothetical protein [Amycolatopsis taiwanensis]GLY66560.1 membrane protein [Amycolatopsis taiwanensis]
MGEHTHPGTPTADGVPPASPQREGSVAPEREIRPGSAWVGWIWFAGAMMILLGFFNIIEGIVALFSPRFYIVSPSGLLLFNLTGWGLVHLIIGILAVAAGAALFTGALWARITAVVLAGINAIAQLTFLSAHPVWATIVIALDVVVIWAVIAHGREVERAAW